MSGPVRFGNYLLLERVNVGGMAEVFKAKAFGIEGFERLVAVKRILPNIAEDAEFVTMFIDEAKIAVQLNHANIAQIFELGKVGDSYFIAMEFVDGKDLRVLLDRARQPRTGPSGESRIPGGPVPEAIACHIVMKICEGLDYAHNKRNASGERLNLVHRDVSPQNVIVSYEGEVKIVDFGIAKAVGKVSKTQSGILKGKFGYMSPEQVRGLPLDRRSDVFTVGICLYELLSNRRLFLGQSDFSTLEKVRNVEVLPLSSYVPDISEELERIVLKALAKNVEDRYASTGDLCIDLQAYALRNGVLCTQNQLSEYMHKTFATATGDERSVKPPPTPERARMIDKSAGAVVSADVGAADRSEMHSEGLGVVDETRSSGARRTRLPSQESNGKLHRHEAANMADDARLAATKYPLALTPPPMTIAPARRRQSAAKPARLEGGNRVGRRSGDHDAEHHAAEAAVIAYEPAVPTRSPLPRQGAQVNVWHGDEMTTRVYDKPNAKVSATWDPLQPGWPLRNSARSPSNGSSGPKVWGFSPPTAGPPRIDSFYNNLDAAGGRNVPPWRQEQPLTPPADAEVSHPGRGLNRSAARHPSSEHHTPQQPAAKRSDAVAARRSLETLTAENERSKGGGRSATNRGTLASEATMITDTRHVGALRSTHAPRFWVRWVAPVAIAAGLLAWWFYPSNQLGTVQVITEPAEAMVAFDDQPLLATASPFLIPNVEPNRTHVLTVTKPGYRSWSMQVHIQPNQTLVLPTVRLVPQPNSDGRDARRRGHADELESVGSVSQGLGGFSLETIPAGAAVLLNDQPTLLRTPVRVNDLKPGTYRIRIEAGPQYLPWRTEVQMSAGQIVALQPVTLQPRELHVDLQSDPPGAVVELVRGDMRRRVGVTPTSTIVDSSEQGWAVQMSHRGYRPWSKELSWTMGQAQTQVVASLQPIEISKALRTPGSARRRAADDRHVETEIDPMANEVAAPVETPVETIEAAPPMVAEPPAATSETGTLRINTKPWTQVSVDGQPIGNTPQLNINLPAGEHTVDLVNPEFNIRSSIKVQIPAGQTITKILDLSAGG